MPICGFCYSHRNEMFCVYKVILHTDKAICEFGIQSLLNHLDDWLLKKFYHLSASQILLLRPDIVLEFFKDFRPNDRIICWFFLDNLICKDCYSHYAEHVPLR
jgi:hypothetical protein